MSKKARVRPQPVTADVPEATATLEDEQDPVVVQQEPPAVEPETKTQVSSVFDEIDCMVPTVSKYDDDDDDYDDDAETDYVAEWSETAKKYVWTRYGSQGSVIEYMSVVWFHRPTQNWKTKCLVPNPRPGLNEEPCVEVVRDTKPSVIAKVCKNREYEFLLLKTGKHYLDRLDIKMYGLRANPKEDGYEDPLHELKIRKANKKAQNAKRRKWNNRMSGR